MRASLFDDPETKRWTKIWMGVCIVFAALTAGALAATISHDIVRCNVELVPISAPADWKSWAVLGKLGDYSINAEERCSEHGQLCSVLNAELTTRGVCPRDGIDLNAWFNGGAGLTPMSRMTSEIDVRVAPDGNVFVAAGADLMTNQGIDSAPIFLAAFRRSPTWRHWSFENLRFELLAASLLSVLIWLVFSLIHATRQLSRSDALADADRYKSGARIESGAIVFDDGSPPTAALPNEQSANVAGPVLVFVRASIDGHYRQSPCTHVGEIIEGDRELISGTAVALAKTRAKRGVVAATIAGVVIGAAIALWQLADAISHME